MSESKKKAKFRRHFFDSSILTGRQNRKKRAIFRRERFRRGLHIRKGPLFRRGGHVGILASEKKENNISALPMAKTLKLTGQLPKLSMRTPHEMTSFFGPSF